ncbi:MAG TPA: UDP-N-acetylglucosamine--N-acetylmuramyl-(pentapeptide) pyrophosphoryl-undecaprenol N-acetylglucosamine transferase [Acidimicrobiales bacterium]|jgi:undecaprenyldiphospho-muramoylpentapeptide beta-N-acetylglucosaminyltransferase
MAHRYALMAGGGTAGHLQPALAIAESLVAQGHDRATIEFVGSRRGQDRTALDGRGFPFTLLPGRGIARSLRPRVIAQNLGALAGLAVALIAALGLVARRRPQVVVSVGGYASLPASVGALMFGVPLVLVNVDAAPGVANRLLGRFARASAVGWPGTHLPRAVVTGTPVRPEIAAAGRSADDRRAARRVLGLPEDRPTVVVFGGSLGARHINDAVVGLAEQWQGREDRSIYHIVGRRDWETVEAAISWIGPTGPVVRVPYEERMATVYSAADIVVCRAGAMTVAELAAAGVPSVLVPLPGAPGDHQTANAQVLERAGGAAVLPDIDCDAPRLAAILDRWLADPAALDAMGRAAGSLGRPDAADAGARVVEDHARPALQRKGPP